MYTVYVACIQVFTNHIMAKDPIVIGEGHVRLAEVKM